MRFLSDWMDRFDQRSLRERVMVLLAVLGLMTVLWDSMLMRPLDRQRRQRQQQVESLRVEVAGLDKSVQMLAAKRATDPGTSNRGAVEKLQGEIATLDGQLAGATAGLIAPREMAQVLGQVLSRTSELTLLSLHTLPPESVIAPVVSEPGVAASAAKAGSIQIYKHGVEIEIAGSYLQILHFLESLEALPWRFFWDHIDYTVTQHPQGKVKLTLYTLGLQEGWIGV
jgi:MSHA biogenesis protein MshJ